MSALAMPWESGWGREVYPDSSLPSDPACLEAIALRMDESRQVVGASDAMVRARKRAQEALETPAPVPVDVKTRDEEEQEERRRLLSELEDWLLTDTAWSKLGLILVETKDSSERRQVIGDAFAERSTGTLRARVQALKLFQRWRGRVVPYDEELAYRYMCHLRQNKAPPTRGKAFLEAALLLAAVANSDALTNMAQSARLRGAAFSMYEHKKLRNQRDPLTLKQVRALEALAVEKTSAHEAAVLGHCLFALHSCARWSDLIALAEEPELDDVIVTCHSKRTKTSRGLKKLRVPIPFVGLSGGVSGKAWAVSWLRARKETGLAVDPAVRKLTTSVTYGSDLMDATTASRHLRAFLVEAGCPPGQHQNLGAHSLKATLLSWAARWSMKASSRRILGNHSDRKDHSMLTYSRDVCIAALKDVALIHHCRLHLRHD